MLDRTSSDKPFQNMILGVAYYFKGHISDTPPIYFWQIWKTFWLLHFPPILLIGKIIWKKIYYFLNCRNSNIQSRPLSEPALIYTGIDIQRYNSCPERKCNI